MNQEQKIWIIERAIARYEGGRQQLLESGRAQNEIARFEGNLAGLKIEYALEAEYGENAMDRISRKQFDRLVAWAIKHKETMDALAALRA